MKKTIESLEITDFAAEGKALGRHNEQVVFVKNAAPGDIVDVQIIKKKKGYLEGRITKFHKEAGIREVPFCKHFEYCGGCQWQHIPYEMQLEFKEKQVYQQIKRLAGLESTNSASILGCANHTHYRNKLEFSFSDSRWLLPSEINDENILKSPGLGFHVAGSFDKVLNIESCHLQNSLSNDIRNWIRNSANELGLAFYNVRTQKGILRSLTLRNNRKNEWMVILQVNGKLSPILKELLDGLVNQFSEIKSLYYVINEKVNDTFLDLDTHLYSGDPFIYEAIGDLKFRIGPKSFFQTNPDQAEKLYNKAIELAGDLSSKTVYDLYTGTGTIAIYAAQFANKVVGIESVDQAIADAKVNARENDIHNTTFVCGDMKDTFTYEFLQKHGKPDVIITDPPRDGMHKNVIQILLDLEAPRIVYISCKPATQARDLALLKEKYSLDEVQPVDMFPHTHHIENIVQLNLRKS